jgi:hypothetical protein
MIVRLHSNPPLRKALPQVRLVERPKLLHSITPAERDRIARIAATIPDRVDPLGVVEAIEPPPGADFAEWLVALVLGRCNIERDQFFSGYRWGQISAAAAGIAVLLREKNPRVYSYPRIAQILGRADHTTVLYAVKRWSKLSADYPHIAAAITQIRAEAI